MNLFECFFDQNTLLIADEMIMLLAKHQHDMSVSIIASELPNR
ncbi:hypothetical protein [Helicobacter pylori]|nr:hypothetical protein [Helicobacter pylori]EMH11623.1 hypothetical protein HMPREF1409_00007 [Helicobacter pylori GAM246Ai]